MFGALPLTDMNAAAAELERIKAGYLGKSGCLTEALKGLGKVGWVAAFVYCSGAALRLARFNTNIAVVDRRFFQGLPSPAAAALVVGFIWVVTDAGYSPQTTPWLVWLACALVSRLTALRMLTSRTALSVVPRSLTRLA